MNGACSKHGEDEKCVLWSVKLNRRNHAEGLDVDGSIILEWILGK
jgi:hypothetical protein